MQSITMQRGVIVADDSLAIRANVRQALGEGWRIFLAADGVEAVEYARGVNAELVMLDYRMPRLDGIDACSSIRHLPSYGAVPIVLLTAYDSVELRRRAADAGVTAIFTKPFTATSLRNGVLPLIALGRDARSGRGASALPAVVAGPPALDPRELSAGRDVLAVLRQADAAATHRRYGSFAEIMAARRAQSRS